MVFGATWPFWSLSRNINRLPLLCLRTRLVVGASPHCFVLYYCSLCKIIVQLLSLLTSYIYLAPSFKAWFTYLNT